ncbi:MAG: helix-turn-helix transcriptional regulator [Clostridia bacterium]|nr:helix-turn-helix transcriptional regulator [Clostridia bacterium]MBQ9506954.1 helix-turn-helix transcriptional regulator [Clostridia bacterium]MBR5423813.1 helix-turn-helix transcriptional regulator [Clostridia bacterium]
MLMKDKLISFRKEAGLTQQQVAELLGVDRSTYTCYETGKVMVPISKLQQLAVIYNEDLNAFNTSDVLHMCSGPADPPEKADMRSLPKDERMFLAQIRLLKAMGKTEELQEALSKLTQEEE